MAGRMSPRDLAAYIALAVIWGLSFLVLVKVVDAFGWAGAVALRCFVAAGALYGAARLSRRRLAFSAPLRHFIVLGATTVAAQLVGLSYGTPLIGTAMSAIIVATIPLFAMVIAHLWGLEAITLRGIAGLALGIVGMVMLVGFPAVPVTPAFLTGCAAVLFACFSAAFGSNYAARHMRGVGSWEVTMASFFFGGVVTLPLMLVVPVPGMPQAIDFLYLFILGAGMSALTYVLYFALVAAIGPTRTISVEFAVTVVAVFIGAVFLNEPITALQLIGAVIIIAGCALVLGLIGGARKTGT